MSLEERIKLAEIKSRHRKALRPWYRKPGGLIFLGIIFILVIFTIYCALYILDAVKDIQNKQSTNQANTQKLQAKAALYGQGNYYLGTDQPKLVIVVFSDFACPYCQKFSTSVRQAGEKYKQEVKIIFRDFPVVSETSIDLALAARCAGAQGKFWEMHDLLFENQDKLQKASSDLQLNLLSLAASLKIDTDAFSGCLQDKTYLDNIRRDLEDGEKLAINKTPSWFIGEAKTSGHVEAEAFNTIIDRFLKQAIKNQ